MPNDWKGNRRILADGERTAIAEMARRLSVDQQEQLLRDLEDCCVIPQTDDSSRLFFELKGYVRPAYLGQHVYSVEGMVKDADGSDLTVCIYADHQDRLLELELIKWNDAPICQPDWMTFASRC